MGQLTELAERQHALVSVRQARRWLSQDAIDKRVARGIYERPRRGVLKVAGAPSTWEQDLMAAVLAAGDGAIASLWSAAACWGLDVRRPTHPIITVLLRPGYRRCRLARVEVHETAVTGPSHVGVALGIPVTSVARTLNDMTTCASARFVTKRVDEALHRGLVDLPTLRSVHADLEGRGRRRSTVMRAILARRADGFVPATTDLEVELDELLAAHGVPRPEPQHPVKTDRMTFVCDFAYPELQIALEADGRLAHGGVLAQEDDELRDADLRAAGWEVLRFRSDTSPEGFVAAVLDARRRAQRRIDGRWRAAVGSPPPVSDY
jgi:very-short-patch-repair endonuclease